MKPYGRTIGTGLILGAVFVVVEAAVPTRALAAGPLAAPGAQEGDTITLDLEEALAIAEASNPAYRRALNQLDVGPVQSRATWMNQILPRVQLTVLNTGFNGNLQRQATNFFGDPIENDQSEWRYSSSTSQNMSLSWTIQGGSLLDELAGLGVEESGRELAVHRASRDTEARVRGDYLAVLRQRELLDSEIASLAAVERDLETVERLYAYAVEEDRISILNARLAVEDQRRQIQRQERALDQARLALRTTLGDPDVPPFRLEAVPLPAFDPAGLDAGALVGRALDAHPTIRQSELDLEQARLGVSGAKSNRWPSLSFSYRLGRASYASGGGGGLFDLTHEAEDLSNSFSISLSVPYFSNYFQSRLSEVQAEVGLRNQRESAKETRLQVEQQVRSQLIQLRNQYEALRSAERRHQISEEALGLAREKYRLGALDFPQLDNQVEQERTTRLQVIGARYDFAEALLSLEEAVGGPVGRELPLTGGGR